VLGNGSLFAWREYVFSAPASLKTPGPRRKIDFFPAGRTEKKKFQEKQKKVNFALLAALQ